MPRFSERSLHALGTCHFDLQRVFREVIKEFDCTILEGYRAQDAQEDYFRRGLTKVHYPFSKHNQSPSRAVDAVPFPVDWGDRERMTYFAGYVLGTAAQLGVPLRWGGDWDRDTQVADNVFDDLPHFEMLDDPAQGRAI